MSSRGVTRSFEMSLTRADFLRLLPAAVGGDEFVDDGAGFRHQEAGRRWQISLEALPDLELGQLRLERQRVTLRFEAYVDADIAAFMARFAAHFRRGGG